MSTVTHVCIRPRLIINLLPGLWQISSRRGHSFMHAYSKLLISQESIGKKFELRAWMRLGGSVEYLDLVTYIMSVAIYSLSCLVETFVVTRS